MNKLAKRLSPKVRIPIALALILLLAVLIYQERRSGVGDTEKADGNVAFEVVDGAHRELDGSPALALSFSLPLDARNDYGKHLQVLEMPPGEGQKTAVQEPREEEPKATQAFLLNDSSSES